jgi:type I restriction enzyme M protein
MLSGYLLRDVINKVDEINFMSSDDIHTIAYLYESMLREMRDAAGTSGEFYTPRPVIRFIVQQIDPQLGETVLDPACGTGGFLVETMEHVRPTIQTAEQLRALDSDVRGIEKKPLPYLLGMMNLLLHEVQDPHIVRENALGRPLSDIRRADRVDVVLTNPPFGGEEERGIQSNFPEATRISETSFLFLQLVQRLLAEGGRCGIVVSNRVLFGEGIGARIKQRLLDDCDLHTIVRLPPGVFEPYTDVPTNILFFEKTGRTKAIWYYQIPLPQDRRKYSKTKPLLFDEFDDCREWWGGRSRSGRKETAHAWRVSRADIEAAGFDLDQRNPYRVDNTANRDPADVSEDAEAMTRQSGSVISEISCRLRKGELDRALEGGSIVELGDVLEYIEREETVDATKTYRIVGLYSFGRGLIDRGIIEGAGTGYRVLTRVETDDLVISKLGAWEGALSVVPAEYKEC